jgi:homoserine kinase
MGLALNVYNTITFEFLERGLTIELPERDRTAIPADARNLIYRVFCNTLHEHGVTSPGLYFRQTNDIPPVRGLGSSAACVVGGVLMADAYLGGKMSIEEKLEFCAAEDGHPDNVLPALLGGVALGCMDGRKVHYVHFQAPESLCCVAMIPPFALETKKARAALPDMVPFQDAVFNLSRAALLAAALSKGDLSLLTGAMQDRLHQPYREPLIPHYNEVSGIARKHGALSVCLSGAGPTILAFLEDMPVGYMENVQRDLNTLNAGWVAQLLQVDARGAFMTEIR